MLISPPLHIGITILDVSDAGRGDEEEDLPSVVLVANGYKVYIVDGGGEDEAGGRR